MSPSQAWSSSHELLPQPGLGKGETLSGPQSLSPGRNRQSRGSIAAHARGRGLLPTAKELQYCLARAARGPEACREISPQQTEQWPLRFGAEGSLLQQGVLVRKAGWGVQAGEGADSSARDSPGNQGLPPLASVQLRETSLMPG